MLAGAAGAGVITHADAAPGSAVIERLAYATGSAAGHGADAPLPPGHFRNPVLPGCHPDPSICRGPDGYVLATSTFATFPGIALFHSTDLVSWRPVGHALTKPEALRNDGLPVTRGLFAPDISWHAGRYLLVCTMVGGGGNFIVTAERPEGPWSDPQPLGFDGIDPALFIDDDGSAWILNNGAPDGPPRWEGHRAIWMQAFDLARLRPFGPRRVLLDGGVDPATKPVWIEGPHIYRHRGWYYLCAAEGGTWLQHSQVVLRSRHVQGPYEPWPGNPTLTQRDLDPRAADAVTCVGHADLVQAPDGRWWSVFLGCRPLADGHWLLGRETFLLPVNWTDDDWPQILPPGRRVPMALPGPTGQVVDQTRAAPPAWELNFRAQAGAPHPAPPPALGPEWLVLRRPADPRWHLTPRGLVLPASSDPANGLGRPAVLLRRAQHASFTLEADVRPGPDRGAQTGLLMFQSERQHEWLWVGRRESGALRVAWEACDGGRRSLRAERTLDDAPSAVRLRFVVEARQMKAEVRRADDESWLPVGTATGHASLSVQAAGGGNHFTGLLVGVHAWQPA